MMSEWKEVLADEAVRAYLNGDYDVRRPKGHEWVDKLDSVFDAHVKYQIRRKQEYRDVRLPLGVKEAPEVGRLYFFLSGKEAHGYNTSIWDGRDSECRALSRRAIYTDEVIVKRAVAAMGWGTE
jgi:hypothetical protein